MKKLIVLVSVSAIAGALLFHAQSASSDAPKKHDFVVLQAQEYYKFHNYQGPQLTTTYQWDGFFVYNCDTSKGVPAVPLPVVGNPNEITTNKLAQTLADYANQGFKMTFTDGKTFVMSR